MKDADNTRDAQEKNYPEKARALKVTFEIEKFRCDAQRGNSEGEKVKSHAQKFLSDTQKFNL